MSEIRRNVRAYEEITDPYNEVVRENMKEVDDFNRIVNEIQHE